MKTNPRRLLARSACTVSFLILTLFALCISDAASVSAETEYRILWVDGWGRELRTEDSIRQVVADARAAGFNAIFPTMRRRGEVFYQSLIEPLAKELEPDFDPLAVLLEEARSGEPAVEIHPWIVTFPIWNQKDVEPVQPNHPYYRPSEWLMKGWDGNDFVAGNYWADPGHPETHAYLEALIAELVENYPVDGIHFDMIRYAEQSAGYNERSLERFQTLYGVSHRPYPAEEEWSEFRRAQVTDVLRKLRMTIKARRPDAVVSAATLAWGSGPSSESNWLFSSPVRNAFQDWMNWIKEGLLDLNVPMVYKDEQRGSEASQWTSWIRFAKDISGDRLVAIGVGGYKNSVANTIKQIRETRDPTSAGKTADGMAFFSYRSPTDTNEDWEDLSAALVADGSVFDEPAIPPPPPLFFSAGRGHLAGRLRSPINGELLPDVKVQAAGPSIHIGRSDAGGFFVFEGLPAGSYRVSAEPRLEQLGGEGLLQFWRGEIPSGETVEVPDTSRAHPADSDVDGRISAREFAFLTAGHFAGRPGFSAALFRRAEAIWRTGEQYRYDESVLPPSAWVVDHPDAGPFLPITPDEGTAGTFFMLGGEQPEDGGSVVLRLRDGTAGRTVALEKPEEGGWGFVAPQPFPDPSSDTEVFVEIDRSGSLFRSGPILLKAP